MKKTALLSLLVLIAGAAALSLIAVSADIPQDPPEFYFTRLAYSENSRGRGRGGFGGFFGGRTMPIPRVQYTCPEFGGKGFFPRQGSGWGTDYPGADCKFMGGVARLTGIRVHPNPNVIRIMDENLFKYPFVYAVEVGGMYLSPEEAARLREYLLRGGFLHVDDFWGGAEAGNFEDQIRKVFPDRPIELLKLDHEAFHSFFDIDSIVQVPNVNNGCDGAQTWEQPDDREPRIYGISDESGRLMVAITYNADLGDAWEFMDLQCYPEAYSGYAYRIGVNFMIYAMTH
jgi:hypothetical protein